MEVIVCVDDHNGMLFNHRRQSRDQAVIADMWKESKGQNLWISSFSSVLFTEYMETIMVSYTPLDFAQRGDICFIENLNLMPYEQNIEKIIVYRWNRRYPADTYLDIDLKNTWKMIFQTEFAGHSHKKITKEIYIR